MLKASVVGIALRILTSGGKFLLLLVLVRTLGEQEVGVYSLFSSTILFSLYVLGFDFYAYSTREIVGVSEEQKVWYIRDQLIFHLMIYLVVLPSLAGLFLAEFLPWKVFSWFFILIVLEHLSQEMSRLLLALSMPNQANLILFLRSGAWCYVLIAMFWTKDGALALPGVLSSWLIGVGGSVLLGMFYLRRLPWTKVWRTGIDWPWIWRGMRTASIFFVGTVAVTAINLLDRYFIRYFHGEVMVGVYSFYGQIANTLQTFAYTGVISIMLPSLIQAQKSSRLENVFRGLRKLGNRSLMMVIAGTLVIAVGIQPILDFISKPLYATHLSILWVQLGTVAVGALGYFPHYGLYLAKRDRDILFSSLLALAASVLFNSWLVPGLNTMGAALATLVAICVFVVSETVFYFLAWRRNSESPQIIVR